MKNILNSWFREIEPHLLHETPTAAGFLSVTLVVMHRLIFSQTAAQRASSPYLHLHPVVSVAQVLQVGGGVGLDGGEVMLQHVDDLWQLRVTPRKLPEHRQQFVGQFVAFGYRLQLNIIFYKML